MHPFIVGYYGKLFSINVIEKYLWVSSIKCARDTIVSIRIFLVKCAFSSAGHVQHISEEVVIWLYQKPGCRRSLKFAVKLCIPLRKGQTF